MEGDLTFNLDETQKMVPVRLLEMSEKDGLLEDKQVKQFVMDLSNPRQGGKLGRYPRTTVTLTEQPGETNARGFTSALPTPLFQTRALIATVSSLPLHYCVLSRAQCDDVQKGHQELQHI